VQEEEFNELFFQTNLAFFMQILIMSIVYVKMPTDEYVEPSAIQMVLRIIMCFLYHLAVQDDVANACKRLKFLAQNPEKFKKEHLFTAFMIILFQIWGAVLNEAVTMLYMT
jgi:uncharacterized membrane protein